MDNIFYDLLNQKYSPLSINIQDFYLELDILVPDFFANKVAIIFDDFVIDDLKNQQFFIDNIDFILHGIKMLKKDIVIFIQDYAMRDYQVVCDENSFQENKIELTTITFSPNTSFGQFKLWFSCDFEEEHGLGILIDKFTLIEIGWADIRFSKRS